MNTVDVPVAGTERSTQGETAQRLAGGSDAQLPWFDMPRFSERLEAAGLPEEDRRRVEFFAGNGYLVWRPEIPDFDELANTIVSRLRPEHERRGGGRVQDAWLEEPAVRKLATHPEVLRMLEQLYRRRPIPFQTLNFLRGTQQRTHSDIIHFSSLPEGFMCGVWFALEDVGLDNGPLHYYPGSHRLRAYEPHHLGITASDGDRDAKYQRYEEFIGTLGEANGLAKEVVTMKRGEAIVWAANLLHGGEPIQDPQSTRLSQVTHYYFEGCRYYTPLHSDLPLGRFHWRDITDITTGKRVPHVYNGRKVRLPLSVRARYAAETAIRRSSAGRVVIERVKAGLRSRH